MSGLSGKWIKFYVRRKHCNVITFHWKTLKHIILSERKTLVFGKFTPPCYSFLFWTPLYKRKDKLKASLSCTWSPNVVKPAKQRGTHQKLHTELCKITNWLNLFCSVIVCQVLLGKHRRIHLLLFWIQIKHTILSVKPPTIRTFNAMK